jgi:ankyrin repeat protein
MIYNQQFDGVELLLNYGAQIRDGLCIAVKTQNTNIISLLLSRDASVNSKDHYGWTPLDIAIDTRNETIITLLAHHGSRFNGSVVLKKLIDQCEISIFNILFHCDYPFTHKPLFYAVKSENVTMTAMFLKHNMKMKGPLHIACDNNIRMVHVLLTHWIDINKVDEDGETPIFLHMKMR